VQNLFDVDSSAQASELVDVMVNGNGVRVERIVSTGQSSPPGFWYEQEQSEWVVVIRGSAEIEFDNGTIESMSAGDHILIPAMQKHRVASTSSEEATVWLAVFFDAKQ
jgi:cupin 2 domain-containing protein